MKRTILNISYGLTLMAILSSAISGCRKEENNLTSKSSNPGQTNKPVVTSLIPVLNCNQPIPAILGVGDTVRLAYQVYATGSQIYQVKRSIVNPTTIVWQNIAPSAQLFAKSDFTSLVGAHYAGPSWEFTKGIFKGSKVVAARSQGVVVDATAIPWLLLKTVDSLSSANNKIALIQRVCTTGGMAPDIIPTEEMLGTVENVPYTAIYLFYTKINPTR